MSKKSRSNRTTLKSARIKAQISALKKQLKEQKSRERRDRTSQRATSKVASKRVESELKKSDAKVRAVSRSLNKSDNSSDPLQRYLNRLIKSKKSLPVSNQKLASDAAPSKSSKKNDSVSSLNKTLKGLVPFNKPISIRNFPVKGKSLSSIFKEMEENPEKFDALKKTDEFWGFSLYGTDSLHVYSNIDLLIDDAFRYQGVKSQFDVFHKRYKSEKLASALKLIRWNTKTGKPGKAWSNQRKVRGKKHDKK